MAWLIIYLHMHRLLDPELGAVTFFVGHPGPRATSLGSFGHVVTLFSIRRLVIGLSRLINGLIWFINISKRLLILFSANQ